MQRNLIVASSPHLRNENVSTRRLMLDVIIALLPTAIAAVWYFGGSALMLMLVAVGSAVLAEYFYQKHTKQKTTVSDLSAVVTGLLLAFNMNKLEARIAVHQSDLRSAPEMLGVGILDAVVCNPPYVERGSGTVSPGESRRLAMQETDCTLNDVLDTSALLLKNQGRIWICLPAIRALALWDGMRARRLEPKRVQMVSAKATKEPYLLLTEGVKNARPSLRWMPPLIACREDGSATEALNALYHG